jgi:hypothetical protein
MSDTRERSFAPSRSIDICGFLSVVCLVGLASALTRRRYLPRLTPRYRLIPRPVAALVRTRSVSIAGLRLAMLRKSPHATRRRRLSEGTRRRGGRDAYRTGRRSPDRSTTGRCIIR